MDHRGKKKEILLPSARHLEERLTVSQSVSQSGSRSGKQAGRQTGRQKHAVWLFFSRGPRLQTVEDPRCTGAIGARVVERPLVAANGVGSNPTQRWPAQVDQPNVLFHLTLVQMLLRTNF